MALIDVHTCYYLCDKCILDEEGYIHVYADIVSPLTYELIREALEE